MAASSIVKKSPVPATALTADTLSTVVDVTATYIARWTQRELHKISRNSGLPVCWPLPNGGYMIGSDCVIPENGYWRRLDSSRTHRQLFSQRQSAIFYCLCRQVRENAIAEDIVKYDTEVRILSNDVAHYHSSLERSIQRKDCFRIGVWSARYDDARLMLTRAEQQLKKSITKAKYSTAWEH